MRFNRRQFIAGGAASALVPRKTEAWIHGAYSSADTLLVPIMGDSNSGSGQFFNATYDTTLAGLYQIKHDHTFPLAQEPLDLISMGANEVGPTTKLCQFLINNGHVPAGVVRIVMIPCSWAGTGLSLIAGNTGYWNAAGSRWALDGGNGIAVGNGLYGMINAAKAAYPKNRIWFFNWIEGANDGGNTQAVETAQMQALFAEIRGIYPDAVAAPILVGGIPPDRINPQMGYEVNLNDVIAAQQNISSNISRAYYIDSTTPSVLHSYLSQNFVHYNAASHRGGAYNDSKNTSTSIVSGSYNSSTGLVTLILTANINVAPGSSVVISGVTGTGSFASCSGSFTAGAGTGGTTLTYAIATGLTLTISNSGSGSAVCTNGYVWNSAVTYVPAAMYTPQKCVIGSDNYIYSCLATTTGDDPTTSPTKWAKQWDTSATVADTDCYAYRCYQALLAAGF